MAHPQQGPVQAQLTDHVMQLMGVAAVHKHNSQRINSIDFHRTADLLITASDDDSIHLYNIATGDLLETFLSKKYGVANICMLHPHSCALYATKKPPPSAIDSQWYVIRYHDLQRNEYIRYFKGHTAPIATLTTSPKVDLFMSTSHDKTMRLWDLRTNICQGCMHVPGIPCATFDQQGLVFAVATESGVVKLYDVRSYDKGPFDTFTVSDEANSPSTFSTLSFSNDGKLLLGVVENKVYLIDAFNGQMLGSFATGQSEGGPAMEAAFSPDSKYLVSGCEDRCIRVWSTQTRKEVAVLVGQPGTPTCVKFAPRRILLASACQALALWIPPLQALQPTMPHMAQ